MKKMNAGRGRKQSEEGEGFFLNLGSQEVKLGDFTDYPPFATEPFPTFLCPALCPGG